MRPCPSNPSERFWAGPFFSSDCFFCQSLAARVSSDSPRLKAFCRVAPSVLLNARAMFAARVFLAASFFKLRTSFAVQVRLRLFMLWSPRSSKTLYLLLLKKMISIKLSPEAKRHIDQKGFCIYVFTPALSFDEIEGSNADTSHLVSPCVGTSTIRLAGALGAAPP